MKFYISYRYLLSVCLLNRCSNKIALCALLSVLLSFPITLLASTTNNNYQSTTAQIKQTQNESYTNPSDKLDALTAHTLEAISAGDWTQALSIANTLVAEFPDYALGHWLLAESHTILSMSDPMLSTVPNYSTSLIDLLLEAQSRAQNIDRSNTEFHSKNNLVPSELVQVGQHIDNVVLVDLDASVLYQFDTSSALPKLQKQHYISSGNAGYGKLVEGDNKSPLGIYSVYGFRSDDSLPSLYGSGALMLNYPNALDRSLGRTGSGIWLHGNPIKERSRSPRSSEGCVTMANDHLLALYEDIDINRTHVVLSHNIQWQKPAKLELQKERFKELFEQYKAAWENNRISDLFSLYANDALPEPVRHARRGSTKKVSNSSATQPLFLSPPGIEIADLSQVESDEISLLLNPSLESSSHHKHLVMSFDVLGEGTKARVTLYWERQDLSGYWQIKREVINAGGA